MARAASRPARSLAERYWIVRLEGCGGIGEVYRADDLKLGQEAQCRVVHLYESWGKEEKAERYARMAPSPPSAQ